MVYKWAVLKDAVKVAYWAVVKDERMVV